MSVTAAQLIAEVSVSGADKAKSDLQSVGEQTTQTGGIFKSALGGALSLATGVAGQAFSFLKDQLSDSVKIAMTHQDVMAQTTQAIKSTGDASGMTADAIDQLGESLSKTTDFSHDTTQAGENMLLTFTGIGKQTFPQATQAMLDMAQALHTGPTQEAMLLGKALNDPTQGLTALTREGVTFSAQEKQQIAVMMQHNDVAGAQKVMLKELQTEFGGSAEAAGKTFAGSLQIVQNTLEDLKEHIGSALLPMLGQLTGWISTNALPLLDQFGTWFTSAGLPALQQFGSQVGAFLASLNFQPLIQAVQSLEPPIEQAGKSLASVLGPALKGVDWKGLAQGGIQLLADAIHGIALAIQFASPYLAELIKVAISFGEEIATRIGPIITQFLTNWNAAWPVTSAVLKGVWDEIVGIVKIAWALVSGIIKIGLDLMGGNWRQAWTDLKDMLGGVWDGIKTFLMGGLEAINGLFGGLPGRALQWGRDMIQGFIDGIGQMLGGLSDMAASVASTISSHLHFSKPELGPLADADQWMPDMMTLLSQGMQQNLGKVKAASLSVATTIATGTQPGLSGGLAALPQGAASGSPIQITVQSPDLTLDGRLLTNGLMPYIAGAIRQHTGARF